MTLQVTGLNETVTMIEDLQFEDDLTLRVRDGKLYAYVKKEKTFDEAKVSNIVTVWLTNHEH